MDIVLRGLKFGNSNFYGKVSSPLFFLNSEKQLPPLLHNIFMLYWLPWRQKLKYVTSLAVATVSSNTDNREHK
jgi:hypothetical protein